MFKNTHLVKFILFISIFITTTYLSANPIDIGFVKNKQSNDNGLITLTITNITDHDIKILKWNTLFEKTLSADIFHIENNKKMVPYRGRLVKRSNPTEEDYLVLQVGESRDITVELPKYYKMSTQGTYTINYKGHFKFKSFGYEKKIIKQFKTTEKSINIIYTPSQKKSDILLQKLVANFNECTQPKIDILNTAHDEALIIAKDSSDIMNAAIPNTSAERYNTWFGSADKSRQSIVTTHFNNIYSALDTQNIGFDCSCSEPYYAYVYPSQPYMIYLCNAFWSANTTGTDSQSGTIIHEMAHFTVVAGTDDYVYGQTNSKALAISNPDSAVFNSDNHEYFAENTPFLAMTNIFDFAQIINILTDLPLADSIDNSEEKDIFTFVAPYSGIFTFYTTDTLDTQGGLFNTNYELLIYNDDVDNTNSNFSFTYFLVEGERYYLSVNGYTINIGGYTLNINIPSPTDTSDTDTSNLENFVSRFYIEVLDRIPDSTGLNDWVNRLISGESVGADIARGFIFSNEFINRNTNSLTYVTILYKAFFDRAPDTNGLNGWVNQLNQGTSRSDVLDGFLYSQEFSNLAQIYGIQAVRDVNSFVQRFYLEILGRTADEAGLNDWVNRLTSGESTGADIARGFIFSDEFTQKNTDDATFVTILYKAFFGRDPDSAGLKIWIDLLNQGESRYSIVDGFLYSQEFANLSQTYGIIAVR